MSNRPPPAPPQNNNNNNSYERTPRRVPSIDTNDAASRSDPTSSQGQQQRQRGLQQQRSLPNADMEAFIRSWGADPSSMMSENNNFSLSSPGGGGASANGNGSSSRRGMLLDGVVGWASTGTGFDIGGSRRGRGVGTLGGGVGGGLGSAAGDYPLRIDRSASFDDQDQLIPGMRSNSIAVSNDVNNDDLQARHRRIASTGGDRLPIIDFPSLGLEALDSCADIIMPSLSGGMSALHDAARITDWPSVAALSESNPESARYVGPDGWNALHHACDRRCPHVDVIDSLLNAYPEALVQTNDKGWTPLHRACRNKTPRDVVKLLLRKYPELGKRAAKMRCNDGRSSLHYALLYDAPEGVVDLLLQADPGAVLDEDRDGVSPLGTVWDKYANSFDGRRMMQVLLRPFEGEGWEVGGNDNAVNEESAAAVAQQHQHQQESDKKVAEQRVREAMEKNSPACKALRTNWEKANTLLRAYFRFPLQEEKVDEDNIDSSTETITSTSSSRRRKWRVLHAVSSIKCHPKLFLLARALHPEQSMELDENDLFVGGGRSSDNVMPDPQSPQLSRRTALHFAAMSPLTGREGRNVVKVLLKLNPNAARQVDGYGSLPLHLICQNVRRLHWMNFGPMDIFNAFPEASSCTDGNGRTPLHCVAASAGQYMSFYPRPVTPTGLPNVALEESVIRNLVEANGTAASMADNTGRLPLHYIAEGSENWSEDVQSILDAHPAAAQTRAGPSTSNQLPLHMAASSPDARPSLIMGMVQANPRASSLMDGAGRLPLHLAVDSGRTTWDEGINSIYSAYTPAISIPDESPRRWTVLHAAAASHSAGRSLVEHIISLARDTASVSDTDGRYPLHLACAANRSWEEGGMKAIFDADPSAALSEDVHGLLPFHIAAMRGSCSSTSSPTNDSTATVAESEEGNGTLLENEARRNEANETDNDDLESLEVLFILLRSQPSIVQL